MSKMPPLELDLKPRPSDGHNSDQEIAWGSAHPGGEVFHIPAHKVGLWAFLATATFLFSMLFSAYLGDMGHMGMPGWRSLPIPWVLWQNTIFLLLSSVALQGAWVAVRRGNETGLRLGLVAAGILAALFILGQLEAWRQLAAAGIFLATNPSSSFFYLITTLHGLHVLGGLVAWGRTMGSARKGVYTAQNHVGVELCAVYWHFLLFIWLVMFVLIWFT